LTLKKDFFHTSLLPSVLSFLGKVYIDLDRYQEATEIFKEFLSRFPQDPKIPQILVNLGWCYLKRGDLAQVKEIAYNIIKLSPYEHEHEKALAQYILAELNTYEGNCQEAMPYWFNLLNTSYRQEALFKIAGCSFQENRFKEGLVNIDLLHLEYPNFHNMDQALWMQGESYRELGNISEASTAYQRIIREYKRSSWYRWSLYRMTTFLLEEGDMRGAERYFDVLDRKFPHDDLSYEASLAVGIQKAKRGEYESSLDYLAIAARSGGSEVAKYALCWEGEIHFNLGEFKKAWDAYQTLIEGYPSSYDMLAAIAYLEMGNIQHLLKDPKKARVAYKKAIELSQDERFNESVKILLKELKEVKRENS
jgi:tetratricopeptide (TPR) repeat protein